MLNEWLKVSYDAELKKTASAELTSMLEKLPVAELNKLASGVPLKELYPRTKTASGDLCMKEGGSEEMSFLDRFKGTPLFDQAVALEQEELQAEMADQQRRQQRQAERQNEDTLYDQQSQIRLKKKMLELELAKTEAGGIPGEPAQGAGAPGPVPAEGVQDSSQGLGGGVAKTASAEEKLAWADGLGRALARQDFEKAASVGALTTAGGAAGAVMAKLALDMGGLAKTVGSAVMKHPGAAGAAVGAAGGALAGGPDHRLSGALGGAALGGMAAGTGARMARGQSFGNAARSTLRQGVDTAGAGAQRVADVLPNGMGARVSGAVNRASDFAHNAISGAGGIR